MAVVQSIQRGSVTYGSGDGAAPTAVSITPVTLAQSVLSFTVRCNDGANRLRRHAFTGELSASSIQFTRSTETFAESVTIDWEVIEFDSSVSVQRGTADLTATTTNIALTTVDDTAAFPIFSFRTSLDAVDQRNSAGASITSSGANLTFDLGQTPSSGQCFVAWQVVEFDPADVNVQQGSISIGVGNQTATDTITSVDLAKTFVINSGYYGNHPVFPSVRMPSMLELTNATTVQASRYSAGTTQAMTATYFVVEMLDGSTVESGKTTISNGSTTPTQPSFTALSNPSLMIGGPYQSNAWNSNESGAGHPHDMMATIKVDGTKDGLTLERFASDGDLEVSWFVIDWNAAGGDTTAPTLTSPTASSTGETTASGSVSTDEANGTLYWVVTTSGTAPSAAQVQAGQDNSGSAAAASGSQSVSATGSQAVSPTGLTADTTYTIHYQHEDAAGNDSTVVSSSSFTTDASATFSIALSIKVNTLL